MTEQVHVVFVHGLFSSPAVWADFTRLIGQDADLNPKVSLHRFTYDSPRFRVRPDHRIPDMSDVADQLSGYLKVQLPGAKSIALVTHSQGGLIVQRFLARMINEDQGLELACIKRIVMFACPTDGFLVHFDDAAREFSDDLLDEHLVAQFAFNCYLSAPETGGETSSLAASVAPVRRGAEAAELLRIR
jgi:pimeloyl-ACP methyl ester carboxylesterase